MLNETGTPLERVKYSKNIFYTISIVLQKDIDTEDSQ